MTLSFRFCKAVFTALCFVILLSPIKANHIEKISSSENDIVITAAFISSWEAKEIRDHATITVITTDDFVTAHKLIDELRKFIDEPILVKHNFVNDKISYEITVGRFEDIHEANDYLNLLK